MLLQHCHTPESNCPCALATSSTAAVMAKLARFAVLTLACLSFVAITYAQTDLVRSLAVRPAATIEELQLQAPELFEQEINALQQNATGPAVLTVGDSITAFGYSSDGWVSLLQQDYSHVTFVNKGVPMGNTHSGYMISKWTVTNPKSPLYQQLDRLKVVTFCFGANDASTKPKNLTYRSVPEAEYKANILTSLSIFKAANVNNFLLLTPPPASAPPRIDRRLEVTEGYANIVKEVGREMHIPVVDIFSALQAVPDWRDTVMTKDGLHLAPAGQEVVHAAVCAALKANFPDL